MTNDRIGSPGAKADADRAKGRSPEAPDETEVPLAEASAGAAADRRRAHSGEHGEDFLQELDERSPGFTAEAETDSS